MPAPPATLHGVVFDIFVGSDNRAGFEAGRGGLWSRVANLEQMASCGRWSMHATCSTRDRRVPVASDGRPNFSLLPAWNALHVG